MSNAFTGYYAYFFVFILMMIALYAIMIKRNLIKKMIGMTIFQLSVILFYVLGANKWGGTVPVLDPRLGEPLGGQYINPLPHTLMLTAIVVGVATSGVAFAMIISIYRRFGTLDENTLLQKMRENDE